MAYVDRYHGASVPWRGPYKKDYGVDNLVGIEFEHEIAVGKGSRDKVVDYVEKNINTPTNLWVAERDGSIDAVRGVEFISNPMSYPYTLRGGGIFNKLCDYLHEVGEDRSKPHVGMHVNINIKKWQPDQRARAVHFFRTNGVIGRAVGGRDVGYARYSDPKAPLLSEGEYRDIKLNAAWLPPGGPRLEVRLNRSSTVWKEAAMRTSYVLLGCRFATEMGHDEYQELARTVNRAGVPGTGAKFVEFLEATSLRKHGTNLLEVVRSVAGAKLNNAGGRVRVA